MTSRKNIYRKNQKKSLKKTSGGMSLSSLNDPNKAFEDVLSTGQNILGKLTSFFTGGPPDVKITSIPYTEDYLQDNNLQTNMTPASKEKFLKRSQVSQQGLNFRKYLQQVKPVDNSKQTPQTTWKYTITPGQLKNFSENFCQDINVLFDEEKKSLFNLPDPPFPVPSKNSKCTSIEEESDVEVNDYQQQDGVTNVAGVSIFGEEEEDY